MALFAQGESNGIDLLTTFGFVFGGLQVSRSQKGAKKFLCPMSLLGRWPGTPGIGLRKWQALARAGHPKLTTLGWWFFGWRGGALSS